MLLLDSCLILVEHFYFIYFTYINDSINFEYSMKNIPLSSKAFHKKKLNEKIEQ